MALAAAGWGAASSAALPSPEELPASMVAVVSDVPVSRGRITKAEFQHALVLTAVQAGLGSAPKPGGAGYERLERGAISNLLETAWIQGEAAEMGIAVTRRQVSRGVSLVKKQSFKNEAEYHRFLKEAHYSRRDVNERVELQMLSVRLQRRLQTRIERQARNESEIRQGFKQFVAEFDEKWRARTVCAPEYATERCSNGPPPSGGA